MNDPRRKLLGSLALLPIVVAGCATTAPPDGSDVAASPLPATTRWAGRFAVTLREPGVELREERANGRFLLESDGGGTQLELLSPLGQTMASATLDDGRAELVTSEGRRYAADSPELLTEQVLGWRMPIGDLPRWLRGGLERPSETRHGRPLAGEEHGWAVRLDDWRETGPGRLELDWPATPTVGRRKVNLKLIVDEAS
ncbi:MAG TPA: outer membrane lipoprotein LolB [Burkholderiaceae bacterium]|nr:outer membrane lipoprotein LolB [Burkholderiaceae bacterium]